MPACVICGRDRESKDCHTIQLTAQEREDLSKQGYKVLEKYTYCRPCWSTLSNRVSGPALARGLVEIHLRQVGVPGSEGLANKYHAELLRRISKVQRKKQ